MPKYNSSAVHGSRFSRYSKGPDKGSYSVQHSKEIQPLHKRDKFPSGHKGRFIDLRSVASSHGKMLDELKNLATELRRGEEELLKTQQCHSASDDKEAEDANWIIDRHAVNSTQRETSHGFDKKGTIPSSSHRRYFHNERQLPPNIKDHRTLSNHQQKDERRFTISQTHKNNRQHARHAEVKVWDHRNPQIVARKSQVDRMQQGPSPKGAYAPKGQGFMKNQNIDHRGIGGDVDQRTKRRNNLGNPPSTIVSQMDATPLSGFHDVSREENQDKIHVFTEDKERKSRSLSGISSGHYPVENQRQDAAMEDSDAMEEMNCLLSKIREEVHSIDNCDSSHEHHTPSPFISKQQIGHDRKKPYFSKMKQPNEFLEPKSHKIHPGHGVSGKRKYPNKVNPRHCGKDDRPTNSEKTNTSVYKQNGKGRFSTTYPKNNDVHGGKSSAVSRVITDNKTKFNILEKDEECERRAREFGKLCQLENEVKNIKAELLSLNPKVNSDNDYEITTAKRNRLDEDEDSAIASRQTQQSPGMWMREPISQDKPSESVTLDTPEHPQTIRIGELAHLPTRVRDETVKVLLQQQGNDMSFDYHQSIKKETIAAGGDSPLLKRETSLVSHSQFQQSQTSHPADADNFWLGDLTSVARLIDKNWTTLNVNEKKVIEETLHMIRPETENTSSNFPLSTMDAKSQPGIDASAFCSRCQRNDHTTQDCPCAPQEHAINSLHKYRQLDRNQRVVDEEFDSDYVCQLCDTIGHSAKKCPTIKPKTSGVTSLAVQAAPQKSKVPPGSGALRVIGEDILSKINDENRAYLAAALGKILGNAENDGLLTRGEVSQPVSSVTPSPPATPYSDTDYRSELTVATVGSHCYRCGLAKTAKGHNCMARPQPTYICVKCQQHGHFIEDCPSAQSNVLSRNVCLRCEKPGHLTKDCPTAVEVQPSNKPRLPVEGGSCLTCGHRGHTQSNCHAKVTDVGHRRSLPVIRDQRVHINPQFIRRTPAPRLQTSGNLPPPHQPRLFNQPRMDVACWKCGSREHVAQYCPH